MNEKKSFWQELKEEFKPAKIIAMAAKGALMVVVGVVATKYSNKLFNTNVNNVRPFMKRVQ
jgi:hypothetical protein